MMTEAGPPDPSCPVRGCALGLQRLAGRFACGAGHSFDVSRSGSLTLLQPQDRRSASPGDSAEAVAARGRALAAGAGDELARQVVALVDAHAPPGPLAVLDVGCGEGSFLRALAAARPIAACGIDLAARAADAAARAMPGALIVIGNADRRLPWADAVFDVVLSITARRPVAEMRRVLRPSGVLVVAIPAEDDLIELREAVLGRGDRRDRLASVREELREAFVEREHRVARARPTLDPAVQRDLLASTYRGARASQQPRLEALVPSPVTLAQDLLVLSPRD